jgi:hypothetical protein
MSGPLVAPNPYWRLAAAAGAGYLLGGGRLPRRALGLALTEGGRLALLAVLGDLVSRESITSAPRPQHGSADAGPEEMS